MNKSDYKILKKGTKIYFPLFFRFRRIFGISLFVLKSSNILRVKPIEFLVKNVKRFFRWFWLRRHYFHFWQFFSPSATIYALFNGISYWPPCDLLKVKPKDYQNWNGKLNYFRLSLNSRATTFWSECDIVILNFRA